MIKPDDVISKWIKFRKTCIEIMPLEERKRVFPETLEDEYSWEAGGIRDYILVHMPRPGRQQAAAPIALFD